jgi:two-component system LytT family response regulator
MAENKYRILIADDESLARDSISILLEKVHTCQIIGTSTNGQDAFKKILIEEPDIVFMDIQMPYLDGTEVVEKVNTSAIPFFIFVTAFEDQAIKAFELNAVDYLLKPYSDERFYKSLNKAKNHVNLHRLTRTSLQTNEQVYKKQFSIKSSGKIELIRTDHIIYFKSSGNYTEIHTQDSRHLIRMKITEILEEIDPDIFIRIHRSCIVRTAAIKELQTYFNGEYIITLYDGTELKVSRSYKNNLSSLIN